MSILVLAQIFSNTSILNCRQEACGMLYYDVQSNRKSRKKSMVYYTVEQVLFCCMLKSVIKTNFQP